MPAEARDASIIVICDRAILELNEERTIEDVKRTAALAFAFAAYTCKIKAAIEAQNAMQTVGRGVG